jgi:hypothetical protein
MHWLTGKTTVHLDIRTSDTFLNLDGSSYSPVGQKIGRRSKSIKRKCRSAISIRFSSVQPSCMTDMMGEPTGWLSCLHPGDVVIISHKTACW